MMDRVARREYAEARNARIKEAGRIARDVIGGKVGEELHTLMTVFYGTPVAVQVEDLAAAIIETTEPRQLRSSPCDSTYGGWRCNYQNDPRSPHTWHAAVVEGVVASRWRD